MPGLIEKEQLCIKKVYKHVIPDVLTMSFLCRGQLVLDLISLKSQQRSRAMNSFLMFARNAGKLLVSWSRFSRTGRQSSGGSLDTTAEQSGNGQTGFGRLESVTI